MKPSHFCNRFSLGLVLLLMASSEVQAFNDPVTGRWITRDSMQYADGMNLYEYLLSSPSRWEDPFGTETWCEWPPFPEEKQSIDEMEARRQNPPPCPTWDDLGKKHPRIKTLHDAILSEGCHAPPISCEQMDGKTSGSGGTTTETSVVLRDPVWNDVSAYHELWHVWQNCQRKAAARKWLQGGAKGKLSVPWHEDDTNVCTKSVSAEIDAFWNTNCSNAGKDHCQCVYDRCNARSYRKNCDNSPEKLESACRSILNTYYGCKINEPPKAK